MTSVLRRALIFDFSYDLTIRRAVEKGASTPTAKDTRKSGRNNRKNPNISAKLFNNTEKGEPS
jgi:hypothetical protein